MIINSKIYEEIKRNNNIITTARVAEHLRHLHNYLCAEGVLMMPKKEAVPRENTGVAASFRVLLFINNRG